MIRILRFRIKISIKNTIINIIINYKYTQHLNVVINNTLARNLFELFNFEIRFEMMLRNAFLKFFHSNRDFKV